MYDQTATTEGIFLDIVNDINDSDPLPDEGMDR